MDVEELETEEILEAVGAVAQPCKYSRTYLHIPAFKHFQADYLWPSPADGNVPTPSPAVTKAEDAFQKALKDPLSVSKLNLDPKKPFRPGYGTRGQPITLWANYVEMVPPKDLVLYRYDISTKPDAPGKKMEQVVRLFLQSSEMDSYRADIVSDFRSTIISKQRLPIDTIVVDIKYTPFGEDTPREGAATYKLTLQYTNTLPISELISYITSSNVGQTYVDQLPMLQALNIFVNHHARTTGSIVALGTNKSTGASKKFSLASDADKWELGAGLFAIRGFFTSVRATTCRVLVNVNVSHGAFYHADRLDILIEKFQRENGPNLLKLKRFLLRLQVKSTHLAERKNRAGEVIVRPKTIIGLANPDDGYSLEHRPRVKMRGAGPKDVEFWLNADPVKAAPGATPSASSGKKKGKKPAAGPSLSGKYISVSEFFKNSKLLPPWCLELRKSPRLHITLLTALSKKIQS